MSGPFVDTSGWPAGENPWTYPDLEAEAQSLGFVRIGTLGALDHRPPPADGMRPADHAWFATALPRSSVVLWNEDQATWLELSGWLDDRPAPRLVSAWSDGRIVQTRPVFHRMPRSGDDPRTYTTMAHRPRAGVFSLGVPTDASLEALMAVHREAVERRAGSPMRRGQVRALVDVLDRMVDHQVVLQAMRALQDWTLRVGLAVAALALWCTAGGAPWTVGVGLAILVAALLVGRLPVLWCPRIPPPGAELRALGPEDD
jgi:hypothetical protein